MKKLFKLFTHFFKSRILYGILLYWYGLTRHRAILTNAVRSDSHTYTCFCRSPGQIEALLGPVMEFLLNNRGPEIFQINVFAASSGAEAYTLASILLKQFPNLNFQIKASDLHQEMVEQAIEATYTYNEVHCGMNSKPFITDTFNKIGDRYQVKAEIRAKVSFLAANLLDPKLLDQFSPADIIYAQNVLFHLEQPLAKEAFQNIIQFLKPKSALFIDGMELDMREQLTSEAKLVPLDYKCRKIHEFATRHIDDHWWNYYYGMEPYAFWHPNRIRRFSTIFLKGN
jgi:chemotaxis methyl-accepting protein methylase